MPNDDNSHHTKLPKLVDDGIDNNYGEWEFQSHHALLDWDLLKYIENEPPFIPPFEPTIYHHGLNDNDEIGTVRTVGNREEHDAAVENARPWMAGNNTALARIVAAVPASQLHLLRGIKYAKQAWIALRSVYQPRNSMRSTIIKRDLTNYSCQSDMNVATWLDDMQRLYNSLCYIDNNRMTNTEFVFAILDLMPEDDNWRGFMGLLRQKALQAEAAKLPIDSVSYISAIRDEYWYKQRKRNEAPSHIFTALAECRTRSQKRPRNADLVASSTSQSTPAKRPRLRNPDKKCSNPFCSRTGHDIADCFTYKGAKQGQYLDWWRGPWNLHLPENQRTTANNVPPKNHPAHARLSTPSVQQTQSNTLDTLRSSTNPIQSSDTSTQINSTLASEGQFHAWTTSLDDTTILATLPVLDDNVTRDNSCHHDSGANRHVFYDRNSFESYQTTPPLTVKGFGQNLSATAIGLGSVRLQSHFDNENHTILLQNVLHIPAARSNLISGVQLDNAGVVSTLGNRNIHLSFNNKTIVVGTIINDMYRLNLSIIRPKSQPLISRIAPPPLQSRIGPIVAPSQAPTDFCIA